MREAEGHDQVFALLLRAVADAVDLQLLVEPLGHAQNHVLNQGAGRPVQGLALFFIVGAGDAHHIALHSHADAGVDLLGQGALGALDRHNAVVDRYGDAGGNIYGFSSNSRHCCTPFLFTR